ncbi:MAG: tRNA lysidine(34) synthetase TilS [Alphaproteobacteria bacterium]|nr:tRNA lysidine(34) synthetase TilS [Alphaproteobacteria bacterium]
MNDAERPLDTVAFARLMAPFEPFERRPTIAAAVSGGRDSLAMALLAQDWAERRNGVLVALIVDHGLRSEAAAEAAATRRTLARLGCESAILRWSGVKPRTGLQEAARAARYRLLRDACRERGILHLLVAHQADDQAETVTMRAARGSGPDGLAGMAALVELPELRLLRPLLGAPRSRLTATLAARGMRWFDDPSNDDPRFERARLRAAGTGPGRALDPEGRADRERDLAAAAVAALEVGPDGGLAIDRAIFGQLRRDLRSRLLGRVVQSVGRNDYPPRRDRLERAVDRLSAAVARGKSGKSQDFTLSECRLALRQAPEGGRLRWIVAPEHGRKDGRNGAQPLVPAAFFACGAPAAAHLK